MKDLISAQMIFDEEHGFPTKFDTEAEKFQQITKDLVGLIGEIGEFANVIKKINLSIDRPAEYEFDADAAIPHLGQELADCFIYLTRLSVILNIDLDEVVRKKIEFNVGRYEKLKL